MTRHFKILWAYVRCHTYLLFKGMWRGECFYVERERGKITRVGTMKPIGRTGMILDIFYDNP